MRKLVSFWGPALVVALVCSCSTDDFDDGSTAVDAGSDLDDAVDQAVACVPRFSGTPTCGLLCETGATIVLSETSAYCTVTCGPTNECPEGHLCVRFSPGEEPTSACLPPCAAPEDCDPGFQGACSPEGICGLE